MNSWAMTCSRVLRVYSSLDFFRFWVRSARFGTSLEAKNFGQNVIQVLSPVPSRPSFCVVYAGSCGLFLQRVSPLGKASLQRIDARLALVPVHKIQALATTKDAKVVRKQRNQTLEQRQDLPDPPSKGKTEAIRALLLIALRAPLDPSL